MSGDHNQNQTDSGWRKRQIALDKKAENARELGLDYEPAKTIIEMAREAGLYIATDVNWMPVIGLEYAEKFAKLVREDERNRTWTPEHWTEYERSIAAIEREACAKVCESYTDKSDSDHEAHGYTCAYAIRARGQA